MILVGANFANETDYYRYFFDVPIRWILAWNKATIMCPYRNLRSRIGYTLYKWRARSLQQIADRYGPGKAQSLEITDPEELETLSAWEKAATHQKIAPIYQFSDQELLTN
jgi:hypothetical protein